MLCDDASCSVLRESNLPLPWNRMDFLYLTKKILKRLFSYLKICSILAQTMIIREKILDLSVVKLPLQDHVLS